ncbi:hypothetical protein [Methylobacterium brachiatum]|uniref:hypothetical protein n=1 Tax=Methylobacterium brachiatum TaxID=269660 RepID=UPI002449B3EF|nr:hypothetical protein [Methylobacterium brachiatum]MDH2311407.1 hypothetical protein [Methylobacterium brachiatum]
MPQTLTGWILFAAVVVAGAGGGYSAARVVMAIRDGRTIDRRDVVAAVTFATMLFVSGALLLLVDGR